MFSIDVTFIDQPPTMSYSKMTIDEVFNYISWEAELTISFDDQIVFCEEIAIIELFWYLTNWIKSDPIRNEVPFVYSTVEHTEPILTFLSKKECFWEIDSIWNRCSKPALVEEKLFFSEINRFVDQVTLIVEK